MKLHLGHVYSAIFYLEYVHRAFRPWLEAPESVLELPDRVIQAAFDGFWFFPMAVAGERGLYTFDLKTDRLFLFDLQP